MTETTTKTAIAKPKGKPGAPKGNKNGYRHGLLSGRQPPGCRYIQKQSNWFRQALEKRCAEVHGEVSVYHASIIAAATAWQRHACKARKWATDHHDELTHDQRINFSREEAKAHTEIVLQLKKLNLDQGNDDAWSALSARGQPIASPQQAIASDEAAPGDESHTQSQQRTDEPASPILEASPPSSLARNESNGKIVDASDDNESTEDRNIEAQQQPEHLDPANPIDQGLWNPNTGT